MKLLNHTKARQKLRETTLPLLGILVFIIAIYMLGLELSDAIYHRYEIKQLEQGVEQTLATIIRCKRRSASKGASYYLCDYYYTVEDETGQPHTYNGESTYRASFPKKEKGDLIAIAYAWSDHSVSLIMLGRTHVDTDYIKVWIPIITFTIFFLGSVFAMLACGWLSYYFIKDWIIFQTKGSFYQETAQPVSQMALLKAFLFEDRKEGMVIIGVLFFIILSVWLFFTGQMR